VAHGAKVNGAARPLVAITMGDPAGIGPEIAVGAALAPDVQTAVTPVIFGHLETLRRAAPEAAARLLPVSPERPAGAGEGRVGVVDLGLPRRPLPWGELSAEGGEAAVAYVFAAIDHALAGRVDAVATGPLNKEAMHKAGHRYPGHTEIFGERTGTPDVALMLAARNLRVIHVTSHYSLRDALGRLSTPGILTTIRLADRTCRLLGVASPRVAVAGLNPHNGEHGLFGDEEARLIEPAVARARAEGLDASGPIAPDTVFYKALDFKQYDIVVCQYHDQGHIPFKLLNFDSGVNVTAGLPIIRTSVDHGTAFDIAGKGLARCDSLVEAILMAGEMAGRLPARRD
jgi:4-hydroxythreonine-4-phosphate dehydrogenase